MIIVAASDRFFDIDAYASCIAYAELLNLLGKETKAVCSGPLNVSITPSLRALKADFVTSCQPNETDKFVIADLSEPEYFSSFVDRSSVVEVYDHHPGFEQYWQEKLGDDSHIELVGAAATLIFERYQAEKKLDAMSTVSAQLLAAAILDNTLNLGAKITTDRDRQALTWLMNHAQLDEAWKAMYFEECQVSIEQDLDGSLRDDTKFMQFGNRSDKLCVGQLAIWDASELLANYTEPIAQTMTSIDNTWIVNIISISENKSYLLCNDPDLQAWASQLLHVTFAGNVAVADRMWLRKEIMKASLEA